MYESSCVQVWYMCVSGMCVYKSGYLGYLGECVQMCVSMLYVDMCV